MPNELTTEVLVTLRDCRDLLLGINPAIRWEAVRRLITRLDAVIARLEREIGG